MLLFILAKTVQRSATLVTILIHAAPVHLVTASMSTLLMIRRAFSTALPTTSVTLPSV
jgi:hypothetical protein